MAAPTPATRQAKGVETQRLHSERNAGNQHATDIERINVAKKACVTAAAQFVP